MGSSFSHLDGESQEPSRLGHLIITLCLVAVVFVVFIQVSGINQNPAARFSDLVYGKADKPFVYRILLPGTVRLTTAIIPSPVKTFLEREVGATSFAQKLLFKLHTPQKYLVESGVALVLLYFSLLGFTLSVRYLLAGVFRAPIAFVDLVPLLATLGLMPFFTQGYLYDLSTLFLFTLGLGLLVRARWRTFLLVFVLACLNKETAILLTLVFVIHFSQSKRIERATFIQFLLYQSGIFVTIRLLLSWIFRDNAGSMTHLYLSKHLELYSRYPLVTLLYVSLGILVLFLTFHNRKEKPRFLLHGMLIVVPLGISHILWGWPYEYRVFYEAYPIIFLLCAHTVGRVRGIQIITIEL